MGNIGYNTKPQCKESDCEYKINFLFLRRRYTTEIGKNHPEYNCSQPCLCYNGSQGIDLCKGTNYINKNRDQFEWYYFTNEELDEWRTNNK